MTANELRHELNSGLELWVPKHDYPQFKAVIKKLLAEGDCQVSEWIGVPGHEYKIIRAAT